MNVEDTAQLIRELKAQGATHFKSHDFEVSFSTYAPPDFHPKSAGYTSSDPVYVEPKIAPPDPETEKSNEEATQKIKDLIQTLKMPDDELIDRIFPNGAGL